jgi:hypothetical protein
MNHRRIASVLLLWLAPGLALAQGTRGTSGYWSPPFPIQRADGRPVYVERGVVTALGGRTVAIGSPTFFWMRKDSLGPAEPIVDTASVVWAFTRSGALIAPDGSAEGVPLVDTLRRRKNARLVGINDREMTVAWASVRASLTESSDDADRIDLASFDGTQWTAPTTVITGSRLQLDFPSAVRPGTLLDPMVVAAVVRDSTGYFLRLAHRLDGRWVQADWHGQVFMIHAATASIMSDRSITVIMMATMPGASSGVYSLHGALTSSGISWTPLQRIDSLRGSYSPFASARVGLDSLVVVWSTQEPGATSNVMKTAVSADAGHTWTLSAPLTPHSGVDGAVLVVDHDGGLHVVYRGAPDGQAGVLNAPGMMMHSRWRSGGWSNPVVISTEPSATQPSVGVAPNGQLMAMWAEAIFVPGGALPKSIASLWTPGCRGPS